MLLLRRGQNGKITASFSGWDANRVVLERQGFTSGRPSRGRRQEDRRASLQAAKGAEAEGSAGLRKCWRPKVASLQHRSVAEDKQKRGFYRRLISVHWTICVGGVS
jgi:hypothetical protein